MSFQSWPYPNSKYCTKCGRLLNVNMFYMERNYLKSTCIDCRKKYQRTWNRNNPEKHAALSRKWERNNPTAHKKIVDNYNMNNPAKIKFRKMAHDAWRAGEIKDADYCHVCEAKDVPIFLHHPCYDPGYELVVIPLCAQCHIKAHGGSFTNSINT